MSMLWHLQSCIRRNFSGHGAFWSLLYIILDLGSTSLFLGGVRQNKNGLFGFVETRGDDLLCADCVSENADVTNEQSGSCLLWLFKSCGQLVAYARRWVVIHKYTICQIVPNNALSKRSNSWSVSWTSCLGWAHKDCLTPRIFWSHVWKMIVTQQEAWASMSIEHSQRPSSCTNLFDWSAAFSAVDPKMLLICCGTFQKGPFFLSRSFGRFENTCLYSQTLHETS